MKDAKAVPYSFLADEQRITAAVHLMTDYTESMEKYRDRTGLEGEAFRLFNNALIEMLMAPAPMTLAGARVTSVKVLEKINECLDNSGDIFSIDVLVETVTGSYRSACSEKSIKNHLQYMKACIWSSLQVGEAGMYADIEHALQTSL